ncbi:MAG: hypothetical protein WD971_03120, partial [Pirellulales bacterium]
MMTTLLSGSVAAEELPFPDPDGLELPYDSSMPSEYNGPSELDGVPLPDAESLPPQAMDNEAPSRLVAPPQIVEDTTNLGPQMGQMGEPYLDGGGYPDGQFDGSYGGEHGDYYPWDDQPAPIESSGTWLNRGVWYAEADAMILHRIWARGDTFVGAEDQNVVIPNQLPAVGLLLNTNRLLYIPSAHPGGDAGVRTTLGRFLFRDDHNRDHTAEFTAWAAGDWVSDGVMTSDSPNSLFVTFNLDGGN